MKLFQSALEQARILRESMEWAVLMGIWVEFARTMGEFLDSVERIGHGGGAC